MRWVRDPRTGREFATVGDEVIRWVEGHCVFVDSVWLGEPMRLLPWQQRLLLELFEVDPETMRRRYRFALIGVGRKNGKSELAAAVALWMAFGQGDPSASVYCAAASEEQADVVFEKARRMCELSESLAAMVQVPEGRQQSSPRLMRSGNPYQFIQRLSSKGTTKHGLNPAGVILDELHVWGAGEADELYQALTTSMGARPNGLILAITTAGSDLERSRCYQLYDLGKRIEAGEVEDPTFFFRWWEAPADCEVDDPEAWRIANPSFGYIMDEEFYRGELVRNPEAYFRRLYLNQWVDLSEAAFVTPKQVDACRLDEFELDPRTPSIVGIDLSERRDTTAVVVGQYRDDDARPCGHRGPACLFVRARDWAAPMRPDGKPDPDWEIPLDEVAQEIRRWNRELDVASNVFDPWHSKLLEQDLSAEGLLCEHIYAQGERRTGATALLHQLIVEGRLHWCDPVVRRHLLNARMKEDRTGGYFLAKRARGRPMDVAMAMVNVCYGLQWAKVVKRRPVVMAWASV